MLSQVKRARGHLAAVRAQVLSSSPEEVEQCIPELNEAIACLQGMEPGRDASLLAELRGLKFEIGVISRLVARSAEFYQGWAKVLAAVAAGYTVTGDPAPLTAPGAISVKG
jgi:hypothetical protein